MSLNPNNSTQTRSENHTAATDIYYNTAQHGYPSLSDDTPFDADEQLGLEVPLPFKRVNRRRDVPRSDRIGRSDRAEESGEPLSPALSLERAPIQTLPPENVILAFSFLDPVSLSQCALVCRSWARLSRDDSTWRLAFATTYNVALDAIAPSGEPSSRVRNHPALRRLDYSSWRAECIRRADVLRRWRKSRTPTVLTDPRISTIHSFGFSLDHHFLLSASLDYGVASRSDPFTGKVQKGFLDAAGRLNGNGIGNPNAEFAPDITALGIDADASRLVWGFRSGEVAFTLLGRQGTAPRGAIKTTSFNTATSHHASVTCVALPFGQSRGGVHAANRSSEKLRQRWATMGDLAFTFATAASNGSVHLWSPRHSAPVWTGNIRQAHKQHSSEPPPINSSISALEYHPTSGVLAAGLAAGPVVLWAGIDVNALLAHPSTVHIEHSTQLPGAEYNAAVDDVRRINALVRVVLIHPIYPSLQSTQTPIASSSKTAVVSLELEVEEDAINNLSLVVLHSGDVSIARYQIFLPPQNAGHDSLDEGSPRITTTTYTQHNISAITCFRADFDLPLLKQNIPTNGCTSASPARSSTTSPRVRAADVARKKREPLPMVIGQSSAAVQGDRLARGVLTENKYLVAGTANGEVLIWGVETIHADAAKHDESRETSFSGQRSHISAIPVTMTLGTHPAAITCLDVASNFIFAGTADGVIKVFDALTGALVRVFNDRAARNVASRLLAAGELTAEEADRFTVRSIIASRETFVASIGSQVLSWRAEAVIKSRGARRSNIQNGSRTPSKRMDAKFESRVELRRDVAESEELLKRERETRRDEARRLRYLADERDMGGLDEQEALQYALMLSRDEEEARRVASTNFSDDPIGAIPPMSLPQARAPLPSSASHYSLRHPSQRPSADDTELDPDELQRLDDESSSYVWRSPTPSPSASPALSAVSSPSLRGIGSPSRAWTIVMNASNSGAVSNAASGSGTPNLPGSSYEHSKVRTIAVPSSSRYLHSPTSGSTQSPPLEHDLDQSDAWPRVSSLSPTRQSSSLSLGQMSSSLDVNNASSSSWRHSSFASSPVPSTVSPSTSYTPAHNLGAWGAGSPAIRTTPSPVSRARSSASTSASASESVSPSLLAASLQSRHLPEGQELEDTDDDLRFALELSLAEERSRREKEA